MFLSTLVGDCKFEWLAKISFTGLDRAHTPRNKCIHIFETGGVVRSHHNIRGSQIFSGHLWGRTVHCNTCEHHPWTLKKGCHPHLGCALPGFAYTASEYTRQPLACELMKHLHLFCNLAHKRMLLWKTISQITCWIEKTIEYIKDLMIQVSLCQDSDPVSIH